jgi:stalled ribosome rescue protein Dom34
MRIVKRKITAKNGEGTIRVQADENEDVYHLYNIIALGDAISASTTRNVSSLCICVAIHFEVHQDEFLIKICDVYR